MPIRPDILPEDPGFRGKPRSQVPEESLCQKPREGRTILAWISWIRPLLITIIGQLIRAVRIYDQPSSSVLYRIQNIFKWSSPLIGLKERWEENKNYRTIRQYSENNPQQLINYFRNSKGKEFRKGHCI